MLTAAHVVAEDRSRFLRLALKFDAIATGALGALALVAAPALDNILGISAPLLWPTGLFLVAYAAAIGVVATRPTINRTAAWAAVILNLVWVVDSAALVVAGWLPLTTLGTAFVVAQAIAVLLFADLQFIGLRRVGGRR